MSRYWYNCEKCDKRIKKQPDYCGDILCMECKKEKKQCLFCDKTIIGGKKIRKYCSQSCASKHTLRGRKLSKSHKEKLSKAAWNYSGNGYAKVKYHKVFCPYLNKTISVQGTYELKYANYLNDNGIEWSRGKNVSLQYKKNIYDITRNYYPDFFLIKNNKFIEIKGYYPESDQIKMKLVKEQNETKKIKILFKYDLQKLGINIK